jgi:prepilin signal peptidase PulO-like enzyme (type II secretory pathway)
VTNALTLVAGAIVFGAAGWLGTIVATERYGAIPPRHDGPASRTLPAALLVAVAACVGVLVVAHGPAPDEIAIALLAVVALCVCAAADARTGVIPDLFTLAPLAIVLVDAVVRRAWDPLAGALFALVPFALIALVTRGRGMGWGDVKLAVLGGALVGMGGIALAVVVASLAVTAIGVLRGRGRVPIAFGPYLAASIGAALALGPRV